MLLQTKGAVSDKIDFASSQASDAKAKALEIKEIRLKLGQGVAVNVLQKMGLDLETVRMEVEKEVGSGPPQKSTGNIPYTPRVKKVLALANKEAKALNHSYVGTEHLLLGLLREGEGVAARVLKSDSPMTLFLLHVMSLSAHVDIFVASPVWDGAPLPADQLRRLHAKWQVAASEVMGEQKRPPKKLLLAHLSRLNPLSGSQRDFYVQTSFAQVPPRLFCCLSLAVAQRLPLIRRNRRLQIRPTRRTRTQRSTKGATKSPQVYFLPRCCLMLFRSRRCSCNRLQTTA